MSVVSAPPPQTQIFPALTRDAVEPLGYQAGDFTYGVPAVWRWGEPATLVIGKYCSLSSEIVIFLGGNHRPDFVTTYPFSSVANWPEAAMIEGHPASKGDVRIGNDVWIGRGAWIMSGVTIGDGAVIGARAVVSRDVPPYAVVAGNPARVMRMRFSDDIIRRLSQVRWWDWDVERVRRFIPLLMQPNISKFLEACAGEGLIGDDIDPGQASEAGQT